MMTKILAVDDTETMRRFHTFILTAQGYTVKTATDGRNALEVLKAYQPDIILMDVMMPNMDGIECCRQIKSSDDTKEIKVIMVTSRSEYSMISKAFAAGCDDYVTKPVNQAELLQKIKDLIKLSAIRTMIAGRNNPKGS